MWEFKKKVFRKSSSEDIPPVEAESGFRSTRTLVTLGDTCTFALDEIVYIATQIPTLITSGDVCYTDISYTIRFNGLGKYYRLKLDSDPVNSYIVSISPMGVITQYGLC